MKDLFKIPEVVAAEDGSYDFSKLSDDELSSWIEQASATAAKVAETPDEFAKDFSPAELLEAMTEGVAAIEAAKDALASRQEDGGEAAAETEETAEDVSEKLAELAGRAKAAADEAAAVSEAEEAAQETPEEDEGDEGEGDGGEAGGEAAAEALQASAKGTTRKGLPARSRRSVPAVEEPKPQMVALTAAAEGLGFALGAEIGSDPEEVSENVARMMIRRRQMFGNVPEGTHGDKIPIARADWSDLYPEDRKLGDDLAANMEKIEAVTASARIEAAFAERVKKYGADSLTAAGGLCAPGTPYYQLQMLSVDDRPVRAALATFNADRGSITFAAPAGLTAIDGGVGVKTMAQDAGGGTSAVKTCQVVDCPPFSTVEVDAIYHCLQFGNIGARTFPELLEQWNGLVMAALARVADSRLLDKIKAASTAVTAGSDGLGASATLPSQILTAARAMRSRHRMDPNAVLRVLLPNWVLDLLVSDVYRSQFQRFDMTPEAFVALLRRHNVEPSFYIDGPSDGTQVWGTQPAGTLLGFPSTVEWAIFPEGSFLYLDGGQLELGLVRDSVLNSTNDFQIFGESWESLAYVGIESLWVTTTTCDSGQVNAPVNSGCISY